LRCRFARDILQTVRRSAQFVQLCELLLTGQLGIGSSLPE
jgi:hypothetical protein